MAKDKSKTQDRKEIRIKKEAKALQKNLEKRKKQKELREKLKEQN